MTTITVTRPPVVPTPRGALWAAAAAAQALRWLSAREGRLTTPAPAVAAPVKAESSQAQAWLSNDASRLRSKEAARVRRIADQWRAADPRFAADLYAAADRHER